MNVPQTIVPAFVEVLLISSSFFFLGAPKERTILHWAGMILLCLTFCWSVIFGCLLTISSLTQSI